MSEPRVPVTPQNAALLLIDHQPGVLAMVASLPHEVITANVELLARLGEQTEIPLVVSSTREDVGFLGTSIAEIQEHAPAAYAARVARGGTLDAFDDPRFVAAVAATGRKNLIVAGILTDVCLWHSATSAMAAGYQVRVVADASGTTTELADRITYDRLAGLGAEVTTTLGTLFELYSDLGTPEGLRAEAIATPPALVAA